MMAQAACDYSRLPQVRDSLPSSVRGVGCPVSAQTYGVGQSASPVYNPLTFRRAAGQGAHSVGQGLTVTAAPTSGTHPSVSPVYGVGCPQFVPATVSIYVGPRTVTHSSLAGPRGLAPTV